MSQAPQISVVIPAYNEERFIGRAIRSVLAQKFDDSKYEIIAVNDASDDRTSYAMGLFSDQILIIKNEERLGLPGCLNKAIRRARGKYIVRVDADDYVHTDYLYILQAFLEANTDMDAVACDYLVVDDAENVIERKNCLEAPIGCGIMFRTEHLIDIGMYDDDFHLNEDQDLRIRFEKKYGVHRVALPLYRYRQHQNNMTKNTELRVKYDAKLRQKHSGQAG